MEKRIRNALIYLNSANVLDTLTTFIGLEFFDRYERNFFLASIFDSLGSFTYLLKICAVLIISLGVYYLVELVVNYKHNRERYGMWIHSVLFWFYLFVGTIYALISLINIYRIVG